ncbi:MAG TPA: hypothetical protein VG078_12395 [Acidimicrobiales bacterium]|nr:hypothetical protein [Acidimicrobiales bacterium]
MRSVRCTPAVLVVPAAVLAGHWLGYVLVGSGHGGSHALHHGYLPAVALVALPPSVAAVLLAVVGSGARGGDRRDGATPVAFLVGAQWTLFVGQELVEHALAGDALGVVASPALWLGLAAQVVVAAAAGVVLGAASWAGARAVALLGGVPRWLPSDRGWPTVPVRPPLTGALLPPASSRGPPRRRV